MLNMLDETVDEEPPSRNAKHDTANGHGRDEFSLLNKFRKVFKSRNHDTTLREAIEEYIEDAHASGQHITSIAAHERALISNILRLRDMTVVDAMIPRADIVAIEENTSQQDLLSLLAEKQFSRFPVYRETLDDIIGTLHIKDIMACLARGEKINISELLREVPIVSPSMHILDLLLMMKQIRKHMALVVDEFGGIDGLVTIGDVIEAIVGEVEDEHDQGDQPRIAENREDGTIVADGRVDIDEFEEKYGKFLSEEEREDIDTLGGLVFALAGRIPGRGEILTHPSGMVFEILEAGPRKVNRILIRNMPLQ